MRILKCPFTKNECTYALDCSSINRQPDDTLLCVSLIEHCLQSDSWLERAFNSFEQIHLTYCRLKLSLQILNPAPVIGMFPEPHSNPNSKILVPVSVLKKPLVHSLEIQCNGEELIHLPDRILSSRALALIIYNHQLLPFNKYFVEEKPQDVKDFITSLICSAGKIPEKAYTETDLADEMKDEILDFIEDRISNRMSSFLSNEISDALGVAQGIKSYLFKNNDDTLKAIDKMHDVYSTLPLDIKNQITHELIARASFIRECVVKNANGTFTFPYVALKDFLYVRRVYDWANVLTFVRMAKKFQKGIRETLEVSMKYLNRILLYIAESKGHLKTSDIDKFASHLLNTVAVLQIVNNHFCLLVPIDFGRLRNTINISFLKECRIRKNVGAYGLNIKLARSTHFLIQSSSVSYNLKLMKNSDSGFSLYENNPESFFGRVEESDKIIHLNTRKESITKPRGKPDNRISSKLAINEATYPVIVKYELGFQALAFLVSLFSVSGLVSFVAFLALFKINSVSVGDLIALFASWFVSIIGIVFANVLVRKWSIVDAITRKTLFGLFIVGGVGLVFLVLAFIVKLLV